MYRAKLSYLNFTQFCITQTAVVATVTEDPTANKYNLDVLRNYKVRKQKFSTPSLVKHCCFKTSSNYFYTQQQ